MANSKLYAPESLNGAMWLCKNTYDYVYCLVAFYEFGQMENPLLLDYLKFIGMLLEMEEKGREEMNR